ncbi:hypothetical protein KCV01_g27606, partial [Aureobasidium melanogenum]
MGRIRGRQPGERQQARCLRPRHDGDTQLHDEEGPEHAGARGRRMATPCGDRDRADAADDRDRRIGEQAGERPTSKLEHAAAHGPECRAQADVDDELRTRRLHHRLDDAKAHDRHHQAAVLVPEGVRFKPRRVNPAIDQRGQAVHRESEHRIGQHGKNR